MRRFALTLTALALVLAACAGDSSSGPDLEIERRTGYSVVVDDTGGTVSIGFSEDRDAVSGDEFVVTESIWRVDDGPWNQPPVACLGKGQKVELGVTQVQDADRPGLLKERVIWVACISEGA